MRSATSIICPYCEHEHDEWWEYTNMEQDDQDFEMECINCDKKFDVLVYVTRSFTTLKADDENV